MQHSFSVSLASPSVGVDVVDVSRHREAELWNRPIQPTQHQQQHQQHQQQTNHSQHHLSASWQAVGTSPPVTSLHSLSHRVGGGSFASSSSSSRGNTSPSPSSSLSPLLSPHTISGGHEYGGRAHAAVGSSSSLHPIGSPSSPSPGGRSPSPSPDPMHSRAHDPARIQALIQVVQQLSDSGVSHKFLSQLGIIFKKLHPTLFVKGILKELVDHAAMAGLLVLSGPAGQQQVELTPAGQKIASSWRQTHEAQNLQQIASMKETLQMYAASHQQRDAYQSHTAPTASSNQPMGFSFLDDPSDSAFLAPPSRSHTSTLHHTGSSGINNTGGSHFDTASSVHSTGTSSVHHTGGSYSAHVDAADDRDINATSGSFRSHPRDTARIDLNNIFGPTSTSIFGAVGDDDDADLLANYQDHDAHTDRFRSNSSTTHPAHAQHDSHSSQVVSTQNSFGQLSHTPHAHSNNSTNAHSSFTHSSQTSTRQLQSSPPQFAVNSHHQPHPVQSHINGSNIHAFLSSTGPVPAMPLYTHPSSHPALASHDAAPSDPSALQLLPPLPTSLEEKTFRGEKLKHLKYIFHFRVHPCINFMQKGSCPYDNKNECFDYHRLSTRRRIPRIYEFSNGVFWSYNACRCQAIEKDMRCQKGEGCRYAHCFEESTQILTNRGFMFAHELDAAETSADGMPLIATYNRASHQLEYQSALLQASGSRVYKVDASQGPFEMFEFGSPQDRAKWSADAPADLSSQADRSHHADLLVTSRHAMWASRSSHSAKESFAVVPAEELFSDTRTHQVRMESVITNGVAVDNDWRSLPFAAALDLRTTSELDAFLELYGYFLADGFMSDGDVPCIGFDTKKDADKVRLTDLFATAGLTADMWESHTHASGRIALQITNRRWCVYFDREYGRKDQNGSHLSHTEAHVIPDSATVDTTLEQGQQVEAFNDRVRMDAAKRMETAECLLTHDGVKPVAWLLWWVFHLSQSQSRKVIEGLRMADGGADEEGCAAIYTSSACFRDQLMRLMLHAGFSAVFHLHASTAPRWRVEYNDATASGVFSSQPTFDSTTDVSTRTHVGPVWCVTVPNGLIIARRAKADKSGVVVMASRATVVGNCKEEIAYHPSRFKTQQCSYPLRADGSCSRFGQHCAFSHGIDDVRKPIVLKQGMPHKLIEPSLSLLQDQQQLVAALTGLSLAELNSFSMSGHNNSMAFGGGSNNNTGGGGGSGGYNAHNALHQQTGNTGSNNNTGGSGIHTHGHTGTSQVLQLHQVPHPGLIAWEQQQQQQQQSHSQSNLHSHSHSLAPHGSGHMVLHSTDSPPMHMDKYGSIVSSRGGAHRDSQGASTGALSLAVPMSSDLAYGTAPNSPSLQSANADAAALAALDPKEFMCPLEELPAEREFYLYTYKTHQCENQTLACTKGECTSYHFANKRRRNPRLYRYNSDACVVVKPPHLPHEVGSGGTGWRRPGCCRLGDACEFSHTLLESMYHPTVFKTRLCSKFDERDRSTWQRCPWKRACAHAHGRLELEYSQACVREINMGSVNRGGIHTTAPSEMTRHTGGGSAAIANWSASTTSSPSVHTIARGLFFDANGGSNPFTSHRDDSTTHPADRDHADLSGVPAASDIAQTHFSSRPRSGSLSTVYAHHEFIPAAPSTAQTAPPATSDADHAMRAVLMKQDTAARILRLQQMQMQTESQSQSSHHHLHPDSATQPLVSSASSSSSPSSSALVVGSTSLVDTLRLENSALQERLSRCEKELYLMRIKCDEQEATIKQLQWQADMDQEEKQRNKTQLDAFRQEVTNRLAQHQEHHMRPAFSSSPIAESPSSFSSSHTNSSSSPPLLDGVASQLQLRHDETASVQIAESVLTSPATEEAAGKTDTSKSTYQADHASEPTTTTASS